VTLVAMASASSVMAGKSTNAASGAPDLSSFKGRTLVVTSWGGVWTQLEQKNLYKPFEKATGVKVKIVINGSDPAIPAILQAQQGHQGIDLAEPLNPAELTLKHLASTFPSWLMTTFKQTLSPGRYSSQTFDAGNTATVIACNPAVMKKCPTTPAQFWDVKNFPGPRAIVNDPNEAMPMALEAAGVSPKKLFPLDINNAITRLKKIKPDISVWPSSGSQQQQVLIDKQVGAEIMWNGRAFVVKQQNIPNLQISWKGSLLPEPNGYVVPVGAPDADVAYAYLYWLALHPKNQAAWTTGISYPMPTKELGKLVPKSVAEALPLGNRITAFTDNTWFAQHQTDIEHAWQSYLG
jgi:putative spermidine/putrescine transport system substrate-binding protein